MNTHTHAPGRILVVDDQPANLRVVSTLLGRHGYAVSTAPSGQVALEKADAEQPDLVLLDMMMPGMDGFELLAQFKARDHLMGVPVIFLTAAQDRELLLRAFDAGAVDYIAKPFMPEELTARVGAHLGLKLVRDRLERVARERQELVNLVAHDLKNPLSSVLFASDMVLQGACKPDRVPRYLRMIHDSANDAISYIRAYLENESQARRTRAEGASADLGDTLRWLADRYELQLEGRGMRLHLDVPDQPVAVAIEALVLRQVAENLVTNAMKYAVSGGELSMRGSAGAPGYWQLVVEDRGQGIGAHQQRRLFKPFERLTEEDPAGGLSSGLGLSLARQIMRNAGGDLWYEDREGGGARFVIEMPEARTAQA